MFGEEQAEAPDILVFFNQPALHVVMITLIAVTPQDISTVPIGMAGWNG